MKSIYQNFDKRYPIHMACGRCDNIRTSMQYISFQYGYAYATDSHILVRARLTDISTFDEQDLALLEGKFIHWSNYRKIIKSKGEVTITEDSIIVKEEQYSVSYPLLEFEERLKKVEDLANDNNIILNDLRMEQRRMLRPLLRVLLT